MTTPESRARDAAAHLAAVTAERDALQKEVKKLQTERANLSKYLDGWVHANGPNGWIDELRTTHDKLLWQLDCLLMAAKLYSGRADDCGQLARKTLELKP